jgi:hypothetical protein
MTKLVTALMYNDMRLKRLADRGIDPRQEKLEARGKANAQRLERERQTVTLQEAWSVYLEERRPKWSKLHYRDHVDLSRLGGQPKKRGRGLTETGPLASLMPLRLADLTVGRISDWLNEEAAQRPARARLAFDLLRTFVTWCESRPAYRRLVDPQALSARFRGTVERQL